MSAEQIVVVPPPLIMPVDPPKFTVEEYLAMDRASEARLEYMDGYVMVKDGPYITDASQVYTEEIRAMSGESAPHNRIALNIATRLDRLFEDRECEVYFENIKVRVSPGQYRYPDVMAMCGEAEFDNDKPPALLNPALLVEVLSPSTKSVDRGEKWNEYRSLPTLTDYLVVTQDRVAVTHYARRNATQWIVTDYTSLADTLTLSSLDVTLTLAQIYRKITFAPPASNE